MDRASQHGNQIGYTGVTVGFAFEVGGQERDLAKVFQRKPNELAAAGVQLPIEALHAEHLRTAKLQSFDSGHRQTKR